MRLCGLFCQSELRVTNGFMGSNTGEAKTVLAIYFSLFVGFGVARCFGL